MKLDESNPTNQPAIDFLRNPQRLRFSPKPIVPPKEHLDPYMEAGAHPDYVVRVWDVLGQSLPADCKAIVYGTPALVHPDTGVLLALASGTSYVIRVPDESIDEALKRGCRAEHEWSSGEKTNLEKELGRGWLFGCWAEEEKQWLANTYGAMGNVP